jgi:hypothetical protein
MRKGLHRIVFSAHATDTISSGLSTGSDRSNTVLTKLKIAVFAPMPSASVVTATTNKAGTLNQTANCVANVFE